MPKIARTPNHLYRKGTTYYFRHSVPHELRDPLGRSEIRISLQTGYLSEARPKARILAFGVKRILTRMKKGELPMDDFDQIKVFMNDWLRRLLKENENIAIKDLTPPSPYTQYVPKDTERIIETLKDLMVSKDYNTMRNCMILAAQDGAFGPPDSLPLSDEFAHEFIKTLIMYYRIISHRAEGDYSFENTILPKVSSPEQQSTPQMVQPDQAQRKSMLLSALIKKHGDNRIAAGRWKQKNRKTMEGRLNWLTFIVGDIDASTIDYALMEGFRDTLLKMPKNRAKAVLYRDKTVDEILAMEVETTLADGTINDIIGAISSMFSYAIKLEVMDRNYADGLQIKEEEAADEKRPPFTLDDLQTIFHPEGDIDDFFRQEERFWITIISLLQGMRLEEVAQLHLEDIYEEGDHVVIDVNDKDEKNVKNSYSKRVLPIHPVLRDILNFPGFVERMRGQKAKRLFPNLEQTEAERYGNAVSAWFSRELIKNGIKVDDPDKTFHSLRHTFIGIADCLDGLEEKHVVGVTGHSRQKKKKKDQIHPAYVKKFPSDFLYDKVLSRIGDFGVDWERVAKSKFVNN